MEIHFKLSENETGYDVNNFTVANAIYKACIESKTDIGAALLDAEIIAKMLLLQSKGRVEVEE